MIKEAAKNQEKRAESTFLGKGERKMIAGSARRSS
jgi:hypothetical protein